MRISWKLLLSTVVLVACALAVGSFFLIQSSFQSSLARETRRALEENLLLAQAFDLAYAMERGEGESVEKETILTIMRQIQEGTSANLYLADAQGAVLYSTMRPAIALPVEGTRRWQLCSTAAGTVVQVATSLETNGVAFSFLTEHSVQAVFAARAEQFSASRLYNTCILTAAALATLLFTHLFTRPVRRLQLAAQRMQKGDYAVRVPQTGGDELSALAGSFNAMAQSVQGNVEKITQSAQRQEEFVANFAHEIKTPLTSIIGYADLLRAQALTPEKAFVAANYIFTEGKRLEALSLKLLDLIVAGRQNFLRRKTSSAQLAQAVRAAVQVPLAQRNMTLALDVQDAVLLLEPDLFQTLLINLIDNARKASEDGGAIALLGRAEGDSYCFSVQDEGRGIPEAELGKITEAFYMVDKSRSRAQNGAGLGLALCDRIVKLHGGTMEFASALGAGTTVTVRVPFAGEGGRRRRR